MPRATVGDTSLTRSYIPKVSQTPIISPTIAHFYKPIEDRCIPEGRVVDQLCYTFDHIDRDDDEDDGASPPPSLLVPPYHPSPTTYLNSLGPLDYQPYDIPTSSSEQNDDLLFERQTDLLNQTQQMHKELRGGFKSFGKALRGVFSKKKKLGHPADPVLNVLKNYLQFDNNDKNLYCEFCQRVKQTREHFALSDHVSSSLGELVHLNLWGAYKDSNKVKNDTANVFQDVNHINFFDLEYHEIPNDNERVDLKLNSDNKSQSASSSSSGSGRNSFTADFSVNFKNNADNSDNVFATHDERVTTLEENIFSEGSLDQNPNSSPQVKYGIEKYVGYSKLNTKNYCFVTQLNKNHEPKSFLEASKYPHWTDAMNQEMDALLRNGTWKIVELPKGRKAIGNLEETVYMKSPEGYLPADNKVCRLKKSLYGLKQASRRWNAKLTSTLIENHFSQSKSDYSLYTKSDKGVFLALLVYVDDIIITGNSVSEIEKFKVYLKSKFMIKDLGKLKYFLGIEIVDTEKGICLNQRKCVLDLLSEYGMLACKPAKTPLMSKLVVSNEACEKDPLLDNITDYQKLIGKLIYFTNTRHDISYDVHCLSQFMHSPLKSHLKIAFKILRYLKSCPGLGIHIVKTSGMFLNAYSDADWAKCVITRKSVTGVNRNNA
ncbi:ribonuclease H-like domain-containing protein [Tanacetum coccineum]